MKKLLIVLGVILIWYNKAHIIERLQDLASKAYKLEPTNFEGD